MRWSIHPDCAPPARTVLEELLPLVERGGQPCTLYACPRRAPGFLAQARPGEVRIAYHALTDLARAILEVSARGDGTYTLRRRAFREFGVMADLSRNAVMRPEAIRRLIRLSALMGYSFVGLYMEDTIQIDGEPYFGYQRGAMTPDELRELDGYAASLGVELRPYVQTLAHLNQIMRYQRYEAICDTGDILLAAAGAQPACRPQVPRQVELVFWDYYHLGQARYEAMLQKHKEMTGRVAFAGGAWKWSGFTPCNRFSIETGRDALNACIREKIGSVVITAWGDNGGEASMFSVLPVLYADAALAWGQPGEREGFRALTGLSFDDFLELDRPSRFSPDPAVHGNASKFLLYNDPLLGTFDSLVPDAAAPFYREAALALARVKAGAGEYAPLFETQEALCRLLEVKADLGRRIKAAYDARDPAQLGMILTATIPQALQRLAAFGDALERQWMAENKPFGFEVQDLRLGGLRKRIEHTQKCLQQYLDGAVPRIDELEGARLPFAYFDGAGIGDLNYNLWSSNASPAIV